MGGQRRDRRALKEIGDRQRAAKLLRQRRVNLNEQERMSAEVEEVVVTSDLIDAQQVLPHLGNYLLDFVYGRRVVGRDFRPGVTGSGRRRDGLGVRPAPDVPGDACLKIRSGHGDASQRVVADNSREALDAFRGQHLQRADGRGRRRGRRRVGERPAIEINADPAPADRGALFGEAVEELIDRGVRRKAKPAKD